MQNWKDPGNDFIYLFWWKKFTAVHSCLPGQLEEVTGGVIPEWLVMGYTTLIQKVKNKGTAPGNYRPITCLPTICLL